VPNDSPNASAVRVLGAYRATFVGCIVALSVVTIARQSSAHAHIVPIAITEIVAALLLLFRPTQRAGLVGLLVVFALAGAITVASGQWPFHLVLYAASAVTIVLLDGATR